MYTALLAIGGLYYTHHALSNPKPLKEPMHNVQRRLKDKGGMDPTMWKRSFLLNGGHFYPDSEVDEFFRFPNDLDAVQKRYEMEIDKNYDYGKIYFKQFQRLPNNDANRVPLIPTVIKPFFKEIETKEDPEFPKGEYYFPGVDPYRQQTI